MRKRRYLYICKDCWKKCELRSKAHNYKNWPFCPETGKPVEWVEVTF